ncbi:ankyrin-1-like isoform X4 [Salvia hispanica]|uniref:ankyrin-1-like isoform X4 n=1 Tax=Salvia hispanica TaxID=49212 RepID=UPI002009734D|nr:ankyrin-1-like isoform X4 [Salvia hispanica]
MSWLQILKMLVKTAGSAIFQAVANGDLKQLRAIRKKVDDGWEFRQICDEYCDFSTGQTVLHHAAGIGHLKICRFLIEDVKVHIDASTYKRDTPLVEAVKGGHVKIVEFLIKQGAKISLANVEGFTPLHFAVLNNKMELVELLLIEGAVVDADSVDGTPLQIAVSRGNVEAAKGLLSRGANPAYYYAVADTPLVCAVKSCSFECLNLLLEAGANPNLYYTGFSPLASAAKEGDKKFLKCLLEAKADPNAFQSDIIKPIEDAAMVLNRAAVDILFPVTARLPHYPNWTVDGIIEYTHSEEFWCVIHSEEFKTKMEKRMRICLAVLDLRGEQDASNKEYNHSIVNYRMANLKTLFVYTS